MVRNVCVSRGGKHWSWSWVTLSAVVFGVASISGCTTSSIQQLPPSSLVAIVNRSAPSTDLSGASSCAAVLVDRGVIFTAAHCDLGSDVGLEGSDAQIAAFNLCSTSEIQGYRLEISSVWMPSGNGDLAVLRLRSDISSETASLASVSPRVGDRVTAWGWGAEYPGGPSPCFAEKKDLQVISFSECSDVVELGEPGPYFCAVASEGSRNTCTGDSGGPVFNGNGELVGLVSGGVGCEVDAPGTYLDLVALAELVASEDLEG